MLGLLRAPGVVRRVLKESQKEVRPLTCLVCWKGLRRIDRASEAIVETSLWLGLACVAMHSLWALAATGNLLARGVPCQDVAIKIYEDIKSAELKLRKRAHIRLPCLAFRHAGVAEWCACCGYGSGREQPAKIAWKRREATRYMSGELPEIQRSTTVTRTFLELLMGKTTQEVLGCVVGFKEGT